MGDDGFLTATADPAHPEHAEYREWVGGPFDPAAFDLDEVNGELAGLAWRPLALSASGARGPATSTHYLTSDSSAARHRPRRTPALTGQRSG
jgi:Plasmid pRiA4b ORF-3-like protein